MGYEDPQWRNSVPLLQAGGSLVGPYHFTTNDKAGDQFNWFNMIMGSTSWDLPPAMDCEAYSSQYGLDVGEKIAHEIVETPITNEVYKILFEDNDPVKATTDLMTRDMKTE